MSCHIFVSRKRNTVIVNLGKIAKNERTSSIWRGFFHLNTYIYYIDFPLSLKAFIITETELKLIANAAIIGDSKIPNNG